jgi:hypothetical protein
MRINYREENWDLPDAVSHLTRAKEILAISPHAGEPIEHAMQNRVIAFEHICRAGILAVEEQLTDEAPA